MGTVEILSSCLIILGSTRDQRIPGSGSHGLLCTAQPQVHGGPAAESAPRHQPRRISDLLASTPWGTPSSGNMWGLGSPTLQACHPTPPSSSGELGAAGSRGKTPEAAGRWAVCFPFSCGCVMSLEVGTAGHTLEEMAPSQVHLNTESFTLCRCPFLEPFLSVTP